MLAFALYYSSGGRSGGVERPVVFSSLFLFLDNQTLERRYRASLHRSRSVVHFWNLSAWEDAPGQQLALLTPRRLQAIFAGTH